jgi:hypothetical protein
LLEKSKPKPGMKQVDIERLPTRLLCLVRVSWHKYTVVHIKKDNGKILEYKAPIYTPFQLKPHKKDFKIGGIYKVYVVIPNAFLATVMNELMGSHSDVPHCCYILGC